MIEPVAETTPPPAENRDSTDFARPPAVLVPRVPHLPLPKLDWSHGLPCAAMGGFLSLFLSIIFLSIIPGFFIGPGFLAAGAFSVFLYHRRTQIKLNRGAGARLGAASGAFAFLFLSVVIVATVVYMPEAKREATVVQIREATAARLKANHYDPEQIRNVMDFVNTQEGLVFGFIFTLLILALICIIGASIGGAWYAAWLQKRNRG